MNPVATKSLDHHIGLVRENLAQIHLEIQSGIETKDQKECKEALEALLDYYFKVKFRAVHNLKPNIPNI